MSDRLAISAAVSVLMMSIYVLFGGDATRMPLPSEGVELPHVTAPKVSLDTGDFIQLRR